VSAVRSFADTDLNAYIDGEVTETERAAIEAWLVGDPEAAARLLGLRALDQRLKGTFEFVLDEPASRTMQQAILSQREPSRGPGWTWAAATLGLTLLAGAAGYAGRGWLDARPARSAFVDTAVGAHAVFVPEVRHPVEVAAREEEHLVKWLTKRVGAPLKAPALQAQGFSLVGGRLLADLSIPAAQFMYENAQGQRLTMYVRKDSSAQDTAFAFTAHGELSAFTWVDRPLAYALIGKLSREDLQIVAAAAYEQLQK
jgi:anti-sigma factor RsiW